MLSYIEEFHIQYPSIKLHLSHGTTPEVITFLKEGKIDLGVVRMPIVDPQLEVRESIQLKTVLLQANDMHLKGKVLTLDMLLEHELILFSRNSRVRMAITELFNHYNYTLKPGSRSAA